MVALVIHIERGVRQRRDPDRAAVHRAVRAARCPTHVRLRRQRPLRHQRETPVVSRVRRIVRSHRAEGVKILPARVRKTGSGANGHLKLINPVRARHGEAAGTGFGIVINRNGVGARIVKINVGRLRTAGRRGHWRVVGTAPCRHRIQREPVAGIARPHMANNNVGLNRLGRRDPATHHDATVDQIGFALVQDNVRRAHAGAERINRHRRVVLRRHNEQANVFEEIVRQVLADRADVIRPVVNGGQHTDRPGEHRPRRGRPAGTGNDQRLVRRDAVARVPQKLRGIARQRHHIGQRDDRAIGQPQRIVCKSRRNAMRVVAVTPDLRRGLRRIAQVSFVTVLPLVVINHRAVTGDDN